MLVTRSDLHSSFMADRADGDVPCVAYSPLPGWWKRVSSLHRDLIGDLSMLVIEFPVKHYRVLARLFSMPAAGTHLRELPGLKSKNTMCQAIASLKTHLQQKQYAFDMTLT